MECHCQGHPFPSKVLPTAPKAKKAEEIFPGPSLWTVPGGKFQHSTSFLTYKSTLTNEGEKLFDFPTRCKFFQRIRKHTPDILLVAISTSVSMPLFSCLEAFILVSHFLSQYGRPWSHRATEYLKCDWSKWRPTLNTHQISKPLYEKEGKLPINNLKQIVDIEVNKCSNDSVCLLLFYMATVMAFIWDEARIALLLHAICLHC